ncbi:MAG: hypothetical protein ACP5D2_00310 [Candidatus Nanoarchaeia archaeon]
MEILLDTNFIITCIKQNLDFFSEANKLVDEKITFLLPKQVLQEIEKLSKRKGEKIKDKQSAQIALEMIKLIEPKIINLEEGNVDDAIVAYLKKHNQVILATLDKELKSRTNNSKLVIRGKKKIEII